MLRVVRAGPLLLVQDSGRRGYRRFGVPESGYADPVSARLANRLVGNPDGGALLESLLGDVVVRNEGSGLWVAVTGVDADIRLSRDGRPRAVAAGAAVFLAAGAELAVGRPRAGVRAYIAIAGGVDVPPVLGSRSRDTLSSLGPAPLAAGALVPTGVAVGVPSSVPVAPTAHPPTPGSTLDVALTLGPRADRLDQRGADALFTQRWTVTARADRIGIRLTADQQLTFAVREQLPSEGTVCGAVEVPSDGLPFVLMTDHPVTVGYPVVAVVADEQTRGRLAQCAPGCFVRFRRPTAR